MVRKNNRFKKIISLILLAAVLALTVAFSVGCVSDDNDNNDTNDYVDAGNVNDGDDNKEENVGEENNDMQNPVATFIIKSQSGENLTVRIELYPEKAPITVDNFTKLANSGYYDGLSFHRVVPDGCLQGGGYKFTEPEERRLSIAYPEEVSPIKGEFASNGWTQNDLKHELGVISMARTNVKDSATSQFFICIGSYPSWDGEYAAFGKATDKESLDNIIKLGQSTYGNIGSGFTTFPYPILSIVSVRVA